ncbi:hypothetical protein LRS13_19830 [Svornostia abyssi]|uniref:Asl1-like glycosyl hydrolase catalytic domain-containing protein n=1 Tax=Svornostia abyssi TaxID=2898438 RepID=A0ABY5PE67_9ACTN|nr:hypothetical protein LRS13_19830 [Parviterribacteraceae bacterium J379]
MRRRLVTAFAAFTLAGFAACGADTPDPAPAQTLPEGFVGITAAEVFAANAGARRQALDAQYAAGARSLRQWINWTEIERTRGKFDFRLYDAFMADAARAKLRVVPILFGMPAFHAAKARKGAKVTAVTTFPPKTNASFARYVTAVVKRYGRNGTFWKANPGLTAVPIESYQVWNEPNLPQYWGGKPDARAYVRLLKTGARAIRKADPQAEVLAGGLPESKQGVPLLRFVRQMYAAGAKGSFDTLAVHPYAKTVAGVLDGAKKAHQVSVQAGDGDVAVWITEVGWAAGPRAPGSAFTVTEVQQAKLVGDLYRQGAAQAESMKLRGIIYYAWRDVPPFPGGKDFWGLHTGLVKRNNSVKPALTAYAAAAKAIQAP